ncbi:ABC transporter ATP-binding protein [Micromonospora sp. PLK6-60]|uniref:ABC transporter ATP-binding protein n=1 Tax=Micromonospora sp. PLK6-60 TaxID=2873383 RepID=UPI001CA66187|nr:ABC transporter ATP-binding protein [Micromonospora sp. PLK6-60]MBY8875005.1 ABC transporter ATP-binding protein [Micromonospora sp. PLK6-60]
MSTGIVTTALCKVFPPRRTPWSWRARGTPVAAVSGLSIAIPAGQVTGLLGLNGAGKTTTIRMLSTLLRPTSGTATVDGLDVVADARAVRRRINVIAGGERMVYSRLTGRENLWYFGQLYDVPRARLRRRVGELLELVGLAAAADTPVERYSRGMRQRLVIARGLVNDPAYLLLDEPTLGLDAPIARELRLLVARLAADGVGVLLTSHYLAEVEQLCRHVHVLDGGRLVAQGSPAQLVAQTDRQHVLVVTVGGSVPAAVEAVRAVSRDTGARLDVDVDEAGRDRLTLRHRDDLAGPVVDAVVRAGGSIVTVAVTPPTLEDAILAMSRATPAGVR